MSEIKKVGIGDTLEIEGVEVIVRCFQITVDRSGKSIIIYTLDPLVAAYKDLETEQQKNAMRTQIEAQRMALGIMKQEEL